MSWYTIKKVREQTTTPADNATANTSVAQSVGSKADTGVTTVGTDKTLMAYIKGLLTNLNLLKAFGYDQLAVPKVATLAGGNNAFADVVNITDKGVLTGIVVYAQYASAQVGGSLAITIDGVAVLADTVVIYSPNQAGGVSTWSLSFHHPFSTSLRVQAKNSNTAQGVIICTVAYTTD